MNKTNSFLTKAKSFLKKGTGIYLIVAFALMGIYALVMATPCAALLQYEDTIHFYDAIEPYNDGILYFALAGLFLALNYAVFRNHQRKVYYLSNFIYFGVALAFLIASIVYLFVAVSFYQAQYATLAFSDINAYFTKMGLEVSVNPDTPVFAFGYIIAVLLLLGFVALLLVLLDSLKERLAYEQRRKSGVSSQIQEAK